MSFQGTSALGKAAAVGTIVAGAAIVEAALIPGLLIGGAAVLMPRLLRRGVWSGLGKRLRSSEPIASSSATHVTKVPSSVEPASFDTWHAVVKTITYRVIVTAADFSVNYVVIGELATAAGLSSLSLVAGPIAYFAHEAAWHRYGPASARHQTPLEAVVHVPIPVPTQLGKNTRVNFARVRISRAFAKTATYEGVTAVSEFSANYYFVRDFAAAAGMTAFSMVIAPVVYYIHEKAWDHYDTANAQPHPARGRSLNPPPNNQAGVAA